jgi:type II secretory pathway component PulK
MTRCRDKGIALVTTLLVLLLMSTMIVGLSWLVMGDQKLAETAPIANWRFTAPSQAWKC